MADSGSFSEYLKSMAPSGDPVEFLGKIKTDVTVRRRTTEGVFESAFEPEDHSGLVKQTLEAAALGRALSKREQFALEAIILPGLRPAIDVIGDSFETVDNELWLELNTNAAWRKKLREAIPSVGRIELPFRKRDDVYGGTGFIVGPGLVMTNRHVAEIFATGLGDRNIHFRSGRNAGLNLNRERGNEGVTLEVKRVRMIHPYWDCALLEVAGLPAEAKPLLLTNMPAAEWVTSKIAAIGYPAFDPRNPANVQQDVFDGEYQIKRLQPGLVKPVKDTPSFGKVVAAMTHDCSTLGGNSGSCLVDLTSGEVVGLHFGGAFKQQNYAVPAAALAADARLWDAGVNIKGSRPGKAAPWIRWWNTADEGADTQPDEDARLISSLTAPAATAVAAQASADTSNSKQGLSVSIVADGGVTLSIPLHVTVRLGGTSVPAVPVPTGERRDSGSATTEKMVEPVHDTAYHTRKGYDPAFLAVGAAPRDARKLVVPSPRAKDPSVVAPLLDGGHVLHYQNFSIIMHAKRRLALLTAANVTAEIPLRRPEKGKTYTRASLTGLGKNDQEKWFADSRIDASHQLPDHFYTYDDANFDKGHLVRREDAAWGETFALLRRANGDTYHVTNCSPQVADYNRSNKGEDNWGDLENVIFKQAATERLCLFSGPFLAKDDPVFLGRVPGGQRTRVKIPTRFWKVVVARGASGLQSFGFVLEQDLDDMPAEEGLEFVPLNFARFMEPISEIASEAGIVFAPAILAADQHGIAGGEEVAHLAGAELRR